MMTLTFLENQITDAVEKLSESVININSKKLTMDARFGLIPLEGNGSGIIVDARGYAVTNNHVIDGADRVWINLKDGRTLTGEVIGGDPATDIAVVSVGADNLPTAELGDSEKLKVGQIALAIGNTLGLPGGPTVSAGVISALGRPLPGLDFVFEGLIQTDAAINPGNSGGPLADLNGNVIGINTAMIPHAQGVGFAIPINTIKNVTEQIFEKGRVIRPWLGISGINLNPNVARRYGIAADSEVLMLGISRYGPMYEAGLQRGDILTQIGEVEVKQMKDLLAALSRYSVGEVLIIQFNRNRVLYRTSIRLMETPPQIIN